MVSIIIPVYNTKKIYLKQCIDSVTRQTFQNIEIILIDDGSEKEIFDLCDALKEQDKRIRVFHKENGGVSSARNLGLQMAEGEYISFVDSDDWIEAEFIERLVEAIEGEIDLAICSIDYAKSSTKNILPKEYRLVEYDRMSTYQTLLYSNKVGGFLCNKLFKKSFIKNNLHEELYYTEDFVFTAEYCELIRKMVFVDLPLYHYRHNNESATNTFTYNTRILTLLDAYQELEKIYYRNLPTEISKIKCNTLKIALNLRARYLINHIDNKYEYDKITQIICAYFKGVLFDKRVGIATKMNIVITRLFPKSIFKIKTIFLGRKK